MISVFNSKSKKSDSDIVISDGSADKMPNNLNKIKNFPSNNRCSLPVNNLNIDKRKMMTPEPKGNIFHQTNYKLEHREVHNLYSARSMNIDFPKNGCFVDYDHNFDNKSKDSDKILNTVRSVQFGLNNDMAIRNSKYTSKNSE